MKIYKKATTTLHLDKRKVKIKLGRGIRQADTILSKLFTAIQNIFQEAGMGKQRNQNEKEKIMSSLEDILIFSNSPEELENMLKDLA